MKKAVVFGLLAVLLAAPPVFAAEGGQKAQQTQKSKKPKKAQSARKFANGDQVECYKWGINDNNGGPNGYSGTVVGYAGGLYSVRVSRILYPIFKVLNAHECSEHYVIGGGKRSIVNQTIKVPGHCLEPEGTWDERVAVCQQKCKDETGCQRPCITSWYGW